MPRLEDVAAEIRAVDAFVERRNRSASLAESFTPRQAQQMSMAARLWPDLGPGALLAIGKGNYRPDHPVVVKLAELSAQLNLAEHPAGIQYGDRAVTPAMTRARTMASQRGFHEQRESRDDAMRELQEQGIADSAGRVLSPVANTSTFIVDGEIDEEAAATLEPEKRERLRRFHDLLTRVAEENPDVDFEFVEADNEVAYYDFKSKSVVTRQAGLDTVNPFPIAELAQEYRFPTLADLPGGLGESFEGPIQSAGPGVNSIADTARAGFMTLEAPVQELQGQVRNLYAATHGEPVDWWETQSDLGISLTTPKTDSGSGFFVDPESEVAAERRRREAERGQIGGHNVTLGRWAVDGLTPFDPDTKPALVMSGLVDLVPQVFDPAAVVLGRVGKANAASQLFQAADPAQAAGAVRGLRWAFKPTDARHWLDSQAGQQALSQVAGMTSPTQIWRQTGRKINLDLARRLADEGTDPDAVRSILEPELGTRIRRVADAESLGQPLKSNPIKVMPARGPIDAWDHDIVAYEIDAFMRNAGASDDASAAIIDKVARAGDSPVKLNAAIRDALRETDGLLHRAGVENETLRYKLTNLHLDSHDEASATFRAQQTAQTPTYNNLLVNGEAVHDAGAHLLNELAPRHLTLPDARAVRRMVKEYPTVFGKDPLGTLNRAFVTNPKTGELRLPGTLLEFGMNELWKPLQLMRVAWPIRVIGEEQLRMAAAGYDSMFKHPLSFIAWRAGRRAKGKADSIFHPAAYAADTLGRKGQVDIPGQLIDEAVQHQNGMALSHGGWVDRAQVRTNFKTTFHRGLTAERERFNEAWGSQLIRLHGDPVAHKVATSESLDDAFEWFVRGEGNRFRGDLAAAHPGKFDTPEQARAYLETVAQRIDYHTGGNADLMDAVRTGKLGDEAMLAGTRQHKDLASKLDGYHDTVAPEKVIGEESVTLNESMGSRSLRAWENGVDRMFGFLMTERTNNLSRSPVFKQSYWREAERLIAFGDDATKAQIVAAARRANLGSRAIRRMERVRPSGGFNAAEIDLLAKGHALDETKFLLYDLTQRSRFMDAARLVFPFGEAWQEVITRWFGKGGLVRTNPKTIRRAQQVIQGARGEDFGEVMGAPDGEGFFWKNEWGEEVFVYPGSRLLTDQLLNIPVPLVGRVEGLSMFGTVVPGLGPAVQIPVGWLLETKPGPEFMKSMFASLESTEIPHLGSLKEQLVPFGSIGAQDQAEVLSAGSFVPSWMRTAFDLATAGDNDVGQWGNTVMSMAAYLRTTGRYGNSRADMAQLMEDAEFAARKFYAIKLVAQATSPSAPSPDWQVVTPDDKTVRFRALSEEYQELKRKDYSTADAIFLDRWGEDLLAVVQPKSVSSEYSVPTNREGANWVLSHPGIRDDLPHTYGFFAPQGDPEDFDYSLYAEQLRDGERVQLDPKTWIRLMNNTKGDLVMEQARAQVEGYERTPEGRRFLADTAAWIRDEYPGWGDHSGLPEKAPVDVLIPELYEALDNEAVASTGAAEGLRLYLEGRDEVLAWAESEGYFRSDGLLSGAEGVEAGHDYLRELADWVIGEHPEFEPLWDVVLSREIEEADDGTT